MPLLRKWSGKNLISSREVRELYFVSGKIVIFRKVRENCNDLTGLISDHLRLEETFGATVISTIFLLNEEGKFVRNYHCLGGAGLV